MTNNYLMPGEVPHWNDIGIKQCCNFYI